MSMKVCARRCPGCLFGSTPIVSARRKAQLLRDLRQSDRHFFCHEWGEEVTWRGSFEQMPQMVRIALRLGVVEFVERGAEQIEKFGED